MATFHRLQSTALRYFLEVVRCGSISEAASRVNVAGSAVSRQIAGLEASLGTVLFERRPRGMVLSPAGELLAEHARRASADAERIVAHVQALQGLESGQVRVASSEGFALHFLPALFDEFHARHRGIRFHLGVASPAEVTQRVRQGACDIGVVFSYSRVGYTDVKVEHRQAAPGLAVMRASHPLAALKQLSLSDLQGRAMALPAADTTLRQLFDIACIKQRVAVEPVFTSNYVGALLRFVRQRDVVTLASEVSVRGLLADDGLCAVPFRARTMSDRDIEVQTLLGRTHPEVVRAFRDFLVAQLSSAAKGRGRPAGRDGR